MHVYRYVHVRIYVCIHVYFFTYACMHECIHDPYVCLLIHDTYSCTRILQSVIYRAYFHVDVDARDV
jgi:hypothetical protein